MSGGGGKGSKSAGSQTVKSGPPGWFKPYLQGAVSDASNLYNTSSFFPGQTYADFSPEQEQAFGLQTQRALSGSPVNQAAQNQAASTLNGDYLYGGEGFNAALNAASRSIIPRVNSQFGLAGRSGSGLAATAQTQALGDAFAGLYNNERQRQLGFAGLAPSLANQDYLDIGQLAEVGGQRQQQGQLGINESMARYDFPWANLQRYAGLLQGLSGPSGSQQSTPLYKNPVAGALGGGLIGYQIGGPWGAAAGAGLGLLS